MRFKRENILYFGLLPGSKEVEKHKINHYLGPIVNELLEFWNGFDLPNGKRIWMAVICCTNNIPAARKLCGHILALVSCHQCYKMANINGRNFNFGSFDDMEYWFIEKDLTEHQINVEGWHLCNSKDERKTIFLILTYIGQKC